MRAGGGHTDPASAPQLGGLALSKATFRVTVGAIIIGCQCAIYFVFIYLMVVEERGKIVCHEHLAELLVIGDDILLRAPDALDRDVGAEERVRVAGVGAGRQVGAEDQACEV